MKTLLFGILILAATSCVFDGKHEDYPGQELRPDIPLNGWIKDRLYGTPQKVVTAYYGHLEWDYITEKPAIPTAMYECQTTLYNPTGYPTQYLYTTNIITETKALPDKRIVITQCEQRPRQESTYTYDDKNRTLTSISMGYTYTITYGDTITDYYYRYGWYFPGDTLAYNTEHLVIKQDTMYAGKEETTYDDAARTATLIRYNLHNGKWTAAYKEVYTLNQYGFIDGNYNHYYIKSTATEFEDKAHYIGRYENDKHGNWTLYYSYYQSLHSDGTTHFYVSAYTTRNIQYY